MTNVEDMTAEQLMQAAADKAGTDAPASSTVVEVEGAAVTINTAMLNSWKAFQLLRKLNNSDNVAQIDAAMEFASLISDYDEGAILAHYGEDASIESVVGFAMQIIAAAYPKNLQRS